MDYVLVVPGSGVTKAYTDDLTHGVPVEILTDTSTGNASPTITEGGGWLIISTVDGVLDTSI
jgi:hypothetical protein